MEKQQETIIHHPKISHQQILAYLQNALSLETRQKIKKIRKEDPKYDFLLDLIDQQKTKATIRKQKEADLNIPSSFSDLDKLLLRVFSDTTLPAHS